MFLREPQLPKNNRKKTTVKKQTCMWHHKTSTCGPLRAEELPGRMLVFYGLTTPHFGRERSGRPR